MSRAPSAATAVILAVAAALVAGGVLLLRGGGDRPPAALTGPPAGFDRAELDRAIARGTESYLEDYVRPSLAHVKNGGWVDYTDAAGKVTRLGPRAFVACELYLLTHLPMYEETLGLPEGHALADEVFDWLVEEFDEEEGRWLWSEEGCLHAKGMIALGNRGRRDLVDRAWEWAKASPVWLPEKHMFTMMQSGSIIQTLGDATLSLQGGTGWELGRPLPHAEGSAKHLYAMLNVGHTLDEPEMKELNDGIDAYFSSLELPFLQMNTNDLVGMAWYIFCVREFGLPEGPGYRFCVNTLHQSVDGLDLLSNHFLMNSFTAMRALVIKALILTGRRTEVLDSQVDWLLGIQALNGAWPLSPSAAESWGLTRPPAVGIKMGQMDGANTYLTTVCLIAYRDAVFGREAPAGAG
jgi:hypothetical protein